MDSIPEAYALALLNVEPCDYDFVCGGNHYQKNAVNSATRFTLRAFRARLTEREITTGKFVALSHTSRDAKLEILPIA